MVCSCAIRRFAQFKFRRQVAVGPFYRGFRLLRCARRVKLMAGNMRNLADVRRDRWFDGERIPGDQILEQRRAVSNLEWRCDLVAWKSLTSSVASKEKSSGEHHDQA